MSFSSSVPPLQITPDGVVLPQESAVLQGVLADINAAFGGGLNITNLSTPQGQLATAQAAVIADKNSEIAFIVNQVNPDFAQGIWQDALGQVYFLERKGATATVVTATLTGAIGAIIPQGTLAKDTSDNVYASVQDITIGSSGSVDVQFENVATGPIPCAASTLVQIYQAIPGWDAITNAAAGILGADQESRQDFEFRRRNSVAINGNGSLNAIYANVFNVPGVLDVYATENTTNAPIVVGTTSYTLVPHSLYVAVVGGDDDAIAAAIWAFKNDGSDMNGNTSVIVEDANYNYPRPQYTMKFNRPTTAAIKFVVDIVNNPSLPSDIIAQTRAAIQSRFNGTTGASRERIGGSIFASNYYAGVASISSAVSIVSITVAKNAGSFGNSVDLGIDESPALTDADIAVNLV